MRWWKVVGLAGFAGVAATGVLVARDERRRRSYTSEEVRDRLHARLAEVAEIAATSDPGGDVPAQTSKPGGAADGGDRRSACRWLHRPGRLPTRPIRTPGGR